jgi:hypothetical protein
MPPKHFAPASKKPSTPKPSSDSCTRTPLGCSRTAAIIRSSLPEPPQQKQPRFNPNTAGHSPPNTIQRQNPCSYQSHRLPAGRTQSFRYKSSAHFNLNSQLKLRQPALLHHAIVHKPPLDIDLIDLDLDQLPHLELLLP